MNEAPKLNNRKAIVAHILMSARDFRRCLDFGDCLELPQNRNLSSISISLIHRRNDRVLVTKNAVHRREQHFVCALEGCLPSRAHNLSDRRASL